MHFYFVCRLSEARMGVVLHGIPRNSYILETKVRMHHYNTESLNAHWARIITLPNQRNPTQIIVPARLSWPTSDSIGS